eukprot:369695-Rhodomonas_salina.1
MSSSVNSSGSMLANLGTRDLGKLTRDQGKWTRDQGKLLRTPYAHPDTHPSPPREAVRSTTSHSHRNTVRVCSYAHASLCSYAHASLCSYAHARLCSYAHTSPPR